jgi:small subunit ribosomal protein S13
MYTFKPQDIDFVNSKEKSPCLYMWLANRYGIGYSSGLNICAQLGYNKLVKKSDLLDIELYEIQQYMESSYKLDSFLRKERYIQIDNLIKIKTYRGLRHKEGLPVRGQRSQPNGRTQRALRNSYMRVR